MYTPVPQPISEAVAALWAFNGQRPDNRFGAPQLLRLKAACADAYGFGAQFWFSFSLSEILRSLGCPMYLPVDRRRLALPPEEAAEKLHPTLTATSAKVSYLCPLDWADDPSDVTFGDNQISRLSSAELQEIADAPRLARAFPNRSLNWDTLSQFYWLVVEETVPVSTEPGHRASDRVNPQSDSAFIEDALG
ncbi:hypothetical protein ABMA32_02590 [Mesorhizobium sp. VNQ89]|uniref:hypothetical protein n=1 Tax=Mesorhizobium quangtriensis TaxID=3157709 RepID=UPI0032B86CC8